MSRLVALQPGIDVGVLLQGFAECPAQVGNRDQHQYDHRHSPGKAMRLASKYISFFSISFFALPAGLADLSNDRWPGVLINGRSMGFARREFVEQEAQCTECSAAFAAHDKATRVCKHFRSQRMNGFTFWAAGKHRGYVLASGWGQPWSI